MRDTFGLRLAVSWLYGTRIGRIKRVYTDFFLLLSAYFQFVNKRTDRSA